MKNTIKYALLGAAMALVIPAYATETVCYKVSAIVKKEVAAEPEKVLEVVASQVARNQACSCEIVKAAIIASGADKKLVASIVMTAASEAPEKLRIISQCAVAVAPDALAEVQAVVSELGANAAGGHGAKGGIAYDAKGGEKGGARGDEASPGIGNPLDFPSYGPVGPTPGGPGGFPLFPPGLQPPVVTPASSSPEEA